MENQENINDDNDKELKNRQNLLALQTHGLFCILDDILKYYTQKYDIELHNVCYLTEIIKEKLNTIRQMF